MSAVNKKKIETRYIIQVFSR